MTKTSLDLNNLEVTTFTTTPEPVAPTGDMVQGAYMQANILGDCTGCMSGCGIMGPMSVE